MRRYSWSLPAFWILAGCGQRTPAPAPEPGVIVSTGTIGTAGSLSQSLGQAGIQPLDAAQVERSLRPLFNPRRSRAQDRFEIHKSTAGVFQRILYWPSPFTYYTVERSTRGLFSAQANQVELNETLVGVSGEIKASLWESMEAQGVPPDMIIRFAELFSWRMDFLTEPRAGDIYKMIWKRAEGNQAVRNGDIVCAAYQRKSGSPLSAFPMDGDFFDAKGLSLKGQFLRAPLVYRRISSFFTNRRYHPILRYYRPHHGIDYAAPSGTPASSIADGLVIAKGWRGGLGNEVRIRHAGSYVSVYGHLKGFAKGIRIGSSVKQGQVIGYVGSTGISTGPHLHFGFEHAGRPINFFSVKTHTQRAVPAAQRPRFKRIREQSESMLAQLDKPGGPIRPIMDQPENR